LSGYEYSDRYTLILREEHGWRVLRKVFGPKREEVTGTWRKLHIEEFHELHSLADI
jgi:hypothetical protein